MEGRGRVRGRAGRDTATSTSLRPLALVSATARTGVRADDGGFAAAARLAPRGLVPSDNVTVACSGANAGWLDPSAPGYVAIVERCNPAELRIAPSTMTMTDVAALADGSLIVRIADPSSTRVAEGVNVSAKRTLTLAEIIARHQAAAARQADAISTTISTAASP